MTRQSGDDIRYGRVWNGFDYSLQVWVLDGIIQDCGHPEEMKAVGCCNQHKLAGKRILEVGELRSEKLNRATDREAL